MSDRPIQSGDLVVAVRLHCEQSAVTWLGKIRTVSGFRFDTNGLCQYCGQPTATSQGCATFEEGFHLPVPYLKRIPPLEELEGQRTEEKLREPAYSK